MPRETRRTQSILTASLVSVAAATSIAVTPALAQRCYEVVHSDQVELRARPRRNARIVHSIPGGTFLSKVGLPVCGLWWCRVRAPGAGQIGYVRSRYLRLRRCRPHVLARAPDVSEHGLSRHQLYQMFIVERGLAPVTAQRPKKLFRFPRDADDGKTYGIDISHHNGKVNWRSVARAGVRFAYLKATEGVTFVDRRFAANLAAARRNAVPVGAYHFFSAGTSPKRQADNFLRIYGRRATGRDLPPVLDLEWDPNRRRQDRWTRRTPRQIVDRALVWLRHVEQTLGVRPIIYTNKSWWEARIGRHGRRLQDYAIWISRYGKFGRANPPMPRGLQWAIWQFTEHGRVAGVRGKVDVNFLAPSFDLTN